MSRRAEDTSAQRVIAVEQKASASVLSAYSCSGTGTSLCLTVKQRASAAVLSAILLQWYWDVPLLPDNVFLFSRLVQIRILPIWKSNTGAVSASSENNS